MDDKDSDEIIWICGHCDEEKDNELGICMNCHKFPTKNCPTKRKHV